MRWGYGKAQRLMDVFMAYRLVEPRRGAGSARGVSPCALATARAATPPAVASDDRRAVRRETKGRSGAGRSVGMAGFRQRGGGSWDSVPLDAFGRDAGLL